MPSDDVREWDGSAIASELLVVLSDAPEDRASPPARLVAGSEDGSPVALSVSRLPPLLIGHPNAFFLSPNCAPLEAALALLPEAAQPEARILSAVLGAGRWIDLGLLDLLLRAADGDAVFKSRTEEELATHFEGKADDAGENSSQLSAIRAQKPSFQDRIDRLLDIAGHLANRACELSDEVERPREPEYHLGSPPPDVMHEFRTQLPGFFRSAIERLLKKRKPIPHQAADYLRRQLTESDRSLRRRLAKAEIQPAVTRCRESDVPGGGFCGVETALRGMAAHKAMASLRDRGGGGVGVEGLANLREVAEEQYRDASRRLRRCPEASGAFRWDGEFVTRDRDRIKTTKAMRGWLPRAAARLVDRWHVPVPIPRVNSGSPTENPEHWGCWAACDRALWAWRELSRMAEIIRFATTAEPPAPRYETVPRLRSYGPNLDAYRRLGVPVLRPGRGHVFLAGRVRDLRLRCFARIGLRRGYFHRGTCRLAGYFLTRMTPPDDPPTEPIAEIAAELYVAHAIWNARHSQQSGPACGLTSTGDEEAEVDWGPVRRAAEEGYEVLGRSQPQEVQAWRRRAEGLMNAAILGIPDGTLETFLECEYQASNFGPLGARGMLGLLTSKVVYELEACLENRLSDVVCARLGRSAQDEMHARRSSSHPGTFAARVRNRLSGSADILGLELSTDTPGAPDGSADCPPREIGPDLYLMRGQTLGGRFTVKGGQPTVIQQEVLLSADEVILEVAHSLVAAGHHLIAVTGEEFLVQVREFDAERAREAVRGAAEAGAARLLGTRLLGTAHPRECDHAIQVEPSDVW